MKTLTKTTAFALMMLASTLAYAVVARSATGSGPTQAAAVADAKSTATAPVSYTHLDVYKRQESRIKRLYSIQQKLNAHNIPVDQVYDLFAIRVITETEQDCYAVLGLLHSTWRPVPGRFKDFIACLLYTSRCV